MKKHLALSNPHAMQVAMGVPAHTHTHTHNTYLYAYIYISTYTHTHTHIYLHTHTHTHTQYIYIYIICIYTCISLYNTHTDTHTHTHTYTHSIIHVDNNLATFMGAHWGFGVFGLGSRVWTNGAIMMAPSGISNVISTAFPAWATCRKSSW